jgi:glycosyltransferase involved in cell wall biosynthesis
MKILLVHNFHRSGSSSGDDIVFKNEYNLLKQQNNKVLKYTVSNDAFDKASIISKVRLTFGMLWSFSNYFEIKRIIEIETPDIVHFHTIFPLLSPSVLYAAKRYSAKVILTLHDTRLVCPCATSLRGLRICNKCVDGRYFRMCKYKCFKQSFIESFIVAFIFRFHRICNTFTRNVDKFICLNDSQRQLISNVIPVEKIVKKYNFVEDVNYNISSLITYKLPDRYVVYYGRIGEEKGLRIIMTIWKQLTDIPLVIMGSGPMENEVTNWSKQYNNVYYLKYVKYELCLSIVKSSAFVVFPSIWYEGCPMVMIESMCLGKSIIATDFGFSEEAIVNEFNGIKVKLGDADSFIKYIKLLWNDPKMCLFIEKNAHENYLHHFSKENNYKQLIDIYSN